MDKLPLRKVLAIIRLYLSGWSYGEIAAKVGVSKSTVGNVIAGLKAGRFPEAGDVPEQIELLHELAIDLRQQDLTAGQAAVGIAALSRFHEIGLEPADLKQVVDLCRSLPQETDTPSFIRAALALEDVRKRTSLGLDELETKVAELERAVAELEPLAKQVRQHQEQIKTLDKQRQSLDDDVSGLEEHRQSLNQDVKHKEKREAELSCRVEELEQRAQAADERLATARKDLQTLAGLGLSLEDLSGFTHRLCGVAQCHSIKPEVLRERLLHELEQLGKGLGLETLVQMERHKLTDMKQSTAKLRKELLALEGTTQLLRNEKVELCAALAEERKQISKEAQTIILLAKDTISKLRRNLRHGVDEATAEVQRLRNHALELGKELGHFEAVVQSNQWLEGLLTLVKGDDNITGGQVRVIGLAVLQGMSAWFNQHSSDAWSFSSLRAKLSAVIEELERWKL